MALATRDELQTELANIRVPDLTSFGESDSGQKITFSWAYTYYPTSLSPREVFSFYDGELRRNGWVFRSEEVGYSPDPYLKGFCAYGCRRHYCKGRHEAIIDYYQKGQFSIWLESNEMLSCQDDKNIGPSIPESLFGLGCSTSWLVYAVLIGVIFVKTNRKNFLHFAQQISFRKDDVKWIVLRAIGVFVFSLISIGYEINILYQYLSNK